MQNKQFLGVYSTATKGMHGAVHQRLFFVWALPSKKFAVQRLDSSFKPVDMIKSISEATFKAQYTHEPSIMAIPQGEQIPDGGVADTVATTATDTPDATGAAGAPQDAQLEIAQTEALARQHYAQAVTRLARPQERKAAQTALKTLAELEEGIVREHRFMFADFGIGMRKKKEYDLALAFCRRVISLDPNDDHAHFNVARVLCDMNKLDDAEEHVLTAISMYPAEPVYRAMLEHIGKERRKRARPGRKV